MYANAYHLLKAKTSSSTITIDSVLHSDKPLVYLVAHFQNIKDNFYPFLHLLHSNICMLYILFHACLEPLKMSYFVFSFGSCAIHPVCCSVHWWNDYLVWIGLEMSPVAKTGRFSSNIANISLKIDLCSYLYNVTVTIELASWKPIGLTEMIVIYCWSGRFVILSTIQ